MAETVPAWAEEAPSWAKGEVVPSWATTPRTSAAADLPERLSFAGFETPIPINPELAAYLAKLGGGMSGSYRGIKQTLGLDKGAEAENERLLARLSEDPKVGAYAKAGGFMGAALDPVTLALPVGKAKSLIDMAKYGAAGGTVAGYIAPIEEGGSRVVNAATGFVAGGTLSPVLGAVVTRGRMPLRTPREPAGGIGLAEPAAAQPAGEMQPGPALTSQEATKQALARFRAAGGATRDIAIPEEVPIQELLAARRREFGGINPALAAQAGGGALGAATGALTAEEGATPAEVASRALLGGFAGWQLAKYGANKIAGYKPAPPREGFPSKPSSELPDSVNVVGDAAEPIFARYVSPGTNKQVADLAKQFFAENPGLRDPSRLISDDIHRYVAGGAVDAARLAEHGLTPEAFAAAWRASITEHARALGQLSQVMRTAIQKLGPEELGAIAHGGSVPPPSEALRPAWKKITDLWRATLVTQPVTAMRNAETQLGRVGLDVMLAPLENWLQRLTGRPVTVQPLDGFEELLSLFQRNKANTNKILSAFPSEKQRLFQRYLSDVAAASGQAPEGKVWGALEAGVNAANVLNRAQEFIIRRGIFQTALAHDLRNRGLDLVEIIKNNRIGAIPQEAVAAAVETSLNRTFGTTPEWGTLSRKLIDAVNALPGAALAIPFPRFMYNAIRFQYEFSPMGVLSYLSAGERAAFAAGDVSKVSKAIVGTGLLGAAMLFRNSDYAAEKWYEAQNDKGEIIDLRPFNPFASYLFVADVIKKTRDDALYKLTANDIAQGLLSTNMRAGTGLYLLDNAIGLMTTKYADEKKFWTKAGELTGDFLAGFATPLTAFRDAYDQITEGQGVQRDVRQEFWAPIKSRVPYVSQTLSEAQVPTREGPRVTLDPLLRQATGVTRGGPKNALEKELDRLGFERREVLPSTGDKELDAKYAGVMGAVSERVLVPLVESEKFRGLTDAVKGVVLHEVLSEVRHEVREGVNETLPPEKQLEMEIRKQPPRLRILLEELGVKVK